MPTGENVLGFANRWHAAGIQHAIEYDLPDQTVVSLLSPPFFVASKLEALHDRGGEDWRGEPDFEDIIFVVDNRSELPAEVSSAPDCVRRFLTAQFTRMVDDPLTREDVISVVPPTASGERVEHIMAQMHWIVGAGISEG